MGTNEYTIRSSPGYWTLSGPLNNEKDFHGICTCVYQDGTNDIFIGTFHNGWIAGPGKYYIGVLDRWVTGVWHHYSSYKSYWAIDLDEGSDDDKRIWCAYMISKEEEIPISIHEHYVQELGQVS